LAEPGGAGGGGGVVGLVGTWMLWKYGIPKKPGKTRGRMRCGSASTVRLSTFCILGVCGGVGGRGGNLLRCFFGMGMDLGWRPVVVCGVVLLFCYLGVCFQRDACV